MGPIFERLLEYQAMQDFLPSTISPLHLDMDVLRHTGAKAVLHPVKEVPENMGWKSEAIP